MRGHLEADLDPLGIERRAGHPELNYRTYGFSEADLDREVFINNLLGRERATLREIVGLLREIYCGRIGVEYMHIQALAERQWIKRRFEHRDPRPSLTHAAKKEVLQVLTAAETFERFLDRRYTGTKRFGIKGAESLMPALEAILRVGAELGIEEFVLGMPHRGRLNVLANFMGKPYAAIFSEFQGNASNPEHVHGSGDVKYHLGTSTDREVGNRLVHLSLAANPSHLEAVNPVVLGKARAKQHQRGDTERKKVAGILMHGDAAFAGQGLVAESLELSDLRGYCTGGTIDIIVKNQIGFTTAPSQARSSPYPSDIAKGIQAPIFQSMATIRRRSSRSRAPPRIPPALRQGCRDRPVLLSPPWPQRKRRAGLHAALDVSHDRAPPDDTADLCRKARRRGRRQSGRGRTDGERVRRQSRNAVRGGEELPPEQGGLARRRLGRVRAGARSDPRRPARRHGGAARKAARGGPRAGRQCPRAFT